MSTINSRIYIQNAKGIFLYPEGVEKDAVINFNGEATPRFDGDSLHFAINQVPFHIPVRSIEGKEHGLDWGEVAELFIIWLRFFNLLETDTPFLINVE